MSCCGRPSRVYTATDDHAFTDPQASPASSKPGDLFTAPSLRSDNFTTPSQHPDNFTAPSQHPDNFTSPSQHPDNFTVSAHTSSKPDHPAASSATSPPGAAADHFTASRFAPINNTTSSTKHQHTRAVDRKGYELADESSSTVEPQPGCSKTSQQDRDHRETKWCHSRYDTDSDGNGDGDGDGVVFGEKTPDVSAHDNDDNYADKNVDKKINSIKSDSDSESDTLEKSKLAKPSPDFTASGLTAPSGEAAHERETGTDTLATPKKGKKKRKKKTPKVKDNQIAPDLTMEGTNGAVNQAFEPEHDLSSSQSRKNKLPPIERKTSRKKQTSEGIEDKKDEERFPESTQNAAQTHVTENSKRTSDQNPDRNRSAKSKKSAKVQETERLIRANDPTHNSSYLYANNYISTSKYNLLSFIPKNLFEQFQRLANAYFLVLLILQLVPQISALNPLTTLFPLCAVLVISAMKDAVDDIQRHRSDNQVNNRKSQVLRDGALVDELWHKVVVGDIIRMENNQFVAADLLLLSTSEPNSLLYVETAELDGETNLKVKQALPETAEMEDSNPNLSSFDGEIQCEPPNNRLSKFEGVMNWGGVSYALDNDKVLLRGCVLRNTRWCFGLVIFAGKDTKLMQNSGTTTFKRTNIDRLMNILIVGIFIFLLSVCLVCTICCGVWESMIGYDFQIYMPWDTFVPGGPDTNGTKAKGATTIAVLDFLSYIIVLNTVVPISLYVSVEIIRFAHSWWINWDRKMYYAKTNTPAQSRTTTLNEELGQIEYIFSDKTGTLTQNIMAFNKATINGRAYGDPVDHTGNPIDITEKTPRVDLSFNPYAEKNYEFYDNRLVQLIQSGDENADAFFRCLALCHTVMPEEKDGMLEYQAQSPDEGALVSAARNFGFVFKSRTPQSIDIEVLGESLTYELLCILDFNNVRKRMSVIVRKDGEIRLFCKGADTTVYERLDQSKNAALKELTTAHLNDFAQDGLRTLCLAYKIIDPEVYSEWKSRHHSASTSMIDRDDMLDAVYEEIEDGMTLIGASAIEDKLQDGVPDAIANLAQAGIKIWVLTGDKQETAINIGYSCKLLMDDMEEIYVVDGETYQDVEDQLSKAYDEMLNILSVRSSSFDPAMPAAVQFSNRSKSSGGDSESNGGFALVINGHSLVHALNKNMEVLLLNTGCLCRAVICCRVTPLQKALVVDLVKRHKKTITLAIGDGANDVSMIKTAHIGVGISGMEGMQAVLASDYSIAQFRFLERLLLVHGRWSYLRMCKFLKYFFYKNFAFTLCHFWYAFFCGFSAQTLLDEAFVSLYNVCYTSLPVLALGIFDQDVSDEYSLRYPKLYTPGHLNLLFNKKVFAQSVAEGIVSSMVLFFVPYGAFYNAIRPDGTDLASHMSFGVMVASTLIIAVTLRCALDTTYWSGVNHFTIWGSILFYFAFTFTFYADIFGYKYRGTARNTMSTANFWFTLVLTVVILLVPVVAERFYYIDTRPTLTDKVRLKQKISKSKAKSGEIILRRASTTRRSTRSLSRSGYAFAHQQGFGKLIMAGTNMRSSTSLVSKSRSALSSAFNQGGTGNITPVPKKGAGVSGVRRNSGGQVLPTITGSNSRLTQKTSSNIVLSSITSNEVGGAFNSSNHNNHVPHAAANNNHEPTAAPPMPAPVIESTEL